MLWPRCRHLCWHISPTVWHWPSRFRSQRDDFEQGIFQTTVWCLERKIFISPLGCVKRKDVERVFCSNERRYPLCAKINPFWKYESMLQAIMASEVTCCMKMKTLIDIYRAVIQAHPPRVAHYSHKERVLYQSFEALILAANERAGSEDHAVVLSRSKVSKRRIKRKIWLQCNREERLEDLRNKKTHTWNQ